MIKRETPIRKNNIKILFISALPIKAFIANDFILLNKHFNVKVINYIINGHDILNSLKTIFNMIIGVLWADITFSWFADIHAFFAVRLSKIFKKKSIVVVGGYEVANVPEIGYGLMLDRKYAYVVRYVLENADQVLTVDEGLKKDAIENIGVTGANIQTVPTGYDYETFKPEGEKENLVITVSAGNNWNRALLKGLDIFVRSAAFLPHIKFLLIGIQGDALKKLQEISSPNVEFIGLLSQDQIIPYYQQARVYCQLSMREGLPNSLCEAMLCRCVPVGTDVQGVKTAIWDTGFYVPYADPEATAEAIKKALKSDKGNKARERIMKIFPRERREKDIVEIINHVLQR